MWLTKLISGDNGRPGSTVDGTAKGLAQFSRVVDPIPPPTVVSLTAAGSVTAFDRRRPLAIVSSLAHLLNYEPHNEAGAHSESA